MKSPDEVVADVIERFENLGLKPIIGGSYASSLWGQPRNTQDLDLSVRIRDTDANRIVQVFSDDYVVSLSEIEDAISQNAWPAGFQLLHMEAIFKIDVFIADEPAFASSIEGRSRAIELLPGKSARFFAPEDIALMKLRWYELGNRVSDRQWNDIVQVIEVQGHDFDRTYFLDWAQKLGVRQLAEEALGEAKAID